MISIRSGIHGDTLRPNEAPGMPNRTSSVQHWSTTRNHRLIISCINRYYGVSRAIKGENRSSSIEDTFFKPGQEGEALQKLFNTISPVYDELNDSFSFGLHRVWKRMAVKLSKAKRGDRVLDSCCGSGDIARIAAEIVGKGGQVIGLDFSQDMLEDAKRRRQDGGSRIEWVQGDALEYPYADGYFDAATMGYGLRNVSDIPRALRELHRVLRKGGCVAILDFNNSSDSVVDGIQGFFLDSLVVPAAEAEGVGDEYRYLRPSIKKYPNGQTLEKLARSSGFEKARYYEIGFGLMGCLVCQK